MCDCVFVFQIEDIRTSIEKIDENVTEIKKVFSTILSAPTSDQSKTNTHIEYFLPVAVLCIILIWYLSPSVESQDDLEALTCEIKKSANNARNKLKSQYLLFVYLLGSGMGKGMLIQILSG